VTHGCDVCARIARTERGENPFTEARTSTGYVNLADTQYHEGYTIFVAKHWVAELHELNPDYRIAYLQEMALVAEAVLHAFTPRKLNYELLGNGAPHLHWHLFPRHADDPHARGPVWEDLEFLRSLWTGGARPDEARLTSLKQRLVAALGDTQLKLEERFV
jgi:diadenosine tetraphosphate (Ap4A) HIT family hydrolase